MTSHSETIQAFLRALESGEVDNLADLLSDDFTAAGPTVELDKQQTLSYIRVIYAAFPDFAFNFGDIEEEGNSIWVSGQEAGTHTGTLDLNSFGIPVTLPPTGKAFSLPASTWEFAASGGKITRMQEHITEGGGMRGILAQLGVNLPDS